MSARRKPAKIRRACPWCGRAASECWVLPCLELQQALDTEDDDAMRAFARAAGVHLEKRGVRIA